MPQVSARPFLKGLTPEVCWKTLTISSWGFGFVVFAGFHGVNTCTMTDFKPSRKKAIAGRVGKRCHQPPASQLQHTCLQPNSISRNRDFSMWPSSSCHLSSIPPNREPHVHYREVLGHSMTSGSLVPFLVSTKSLYHPLPISPLLFFSLHPHHAALSFAFSAFLSSPFL